MKRLLKIVVFLVLAVLLLVVAHYSIEVYRAREFTKTEIVKKAASANFEITYQDLTKKQLDILLAVQDPNFFKHQGIDLSTPGAGITTLTQALTKKLYFKRFKPGLAKIRQTLIARFALHPLVSKEDQITMFLNLIYLGKVDSNHAVGFGQAAKIYYMKPFQQLTEDQFISLVAMIIAPKTFNPVTYPQRNAERSRRIKKLVAGEYKPKGLFDMYYGKLDEATIQSGLPTLSYFESYYEEE